MRIGAVYEVHNVQSVHSQQQHNGGLHYDSS